MIQMLQNIEMLQQMGQRQFVMIAQTPKRMNNQQDLQDVKTQPQQLQQQPLKQHSQRYKSFKKILLAIIAITLSSFYFGYMIIYLSVIDFKSVMIIFGIQMELSTAQGLLTFCVPLGGLFGSLFSSYFINQISRRNSLLIINGFAFIFGILLFFAGFKVYMLIRFCQGMCAGLFSAVVPLIVKQLAPFELSGFFGVFPQLFITIGIFTGCFVAFILSSITGDETGLEYWKLVFGFPLLTISIQVFLLMTQYNFEPPKYLIDKNRQNEARQVIKEFYQEEFVQDVIRQYKNQGNQEHQSDQKMQNEEIERSDQGFCKMKQKMDITKKVSVHLAVLQQFVGISAVATYGRELAQGSLESIQSFFPSLLNFVQVVFAGLSSLLLTKYGRKTILQFGTAGSAISNVVIAIGFWLDDSHPTVALILILIALFYYMANFNMSLGPIVWMYIPQIVEPSFLPFSTMVNWGCSALSILLFPIVKANLPGSNPAPMFFFFAIWSSISFFINKKYIVQTKGKTARQIKEAYLNIQNKSL